MFPITITLHDQTQLSAVLAAMSPDAPPLAVAVPAKAAAAEAKTPPAAAETAAEPDAAPSYEDTAAKVTAVARKCGRDAAVEILAKFDKAVTLKDVDPAQFAQVVAACNEKLAS